MSNNPLIPTHPQNPQLQPHFAGLKNLHFPNKSAARKYIRYLNQNFFNDAPAHQLAKTQFTTQLDCLINAFLTAQKLNNLAAFINLPTEPPTRACLLKLLKTNPHPQIFLPHPQQNPTAANSLASPADITPHWSQLQQADQLVTPPKSFSYAGTSPVPSGLLPACDVLLIPAVALAYTGDRLGQGGGWYDRALGNKNVFGSALKLGLIWSTQLFPAPFWPLAAHDIKLDAALTPTGLYCFNASAYQLFADLQINLPYHLCSVPPPQLKRIAKDS